MQKNALQKKIPKANLLEGHFDIFSYLHIFLVYLSLLCVRFNFDLYI